jgi:DNA repair exonuclease SbcCD ATPase subunit
METYETRLETARRRVAEQERLVAIWRETISRLTDEGQSTELAQKMLQLMERRLDAFRAESGSLKRTFRARVTAARNVRRRMKPRDAASCPRPKPP